MKKHLFLLVLALALIPVLSYGQVRGGDIYGTVVSPNGSKIPNVAITLTGGGFAKRTLTSAKGTFRFSQLPPGQYALKCELEGFKTVIQKGIVLRGGSTKNVSIRLERK